MGEEAVTGVTPRGGEDEVEQGEGEGGMERGGDDIGRRTLGDRTNNPSNPENRIPSIFLRFPIIIILLKVNYFPIASLSRRPSIRPFSSTRPGTQPPTPLSHRHHAVLALCPHPHNGDAPHCAFLASGARIHSMLTLSRAPATRFGASGRSVVPIPIPYMYTHAPST